MGAGRSRPLGAAGEGERGGRRRELAAALAAASKPPSRSPRGSVPRILLLGYILDRQVTKIIVVDENIATLPLSLCLCERKILGREIGRNLFFFLCCDVEIKFVYQ